MKTQKIKTLIIEDSDDDLQLMLRELNKGQYEIEYKLVEDAKGLESALEEEWDVIISDYSLPTFTGFEAMIMCKEKVSDIPFIMVSGTIGEDIAVKMMRTHAKDYIIKKNLTRLLPAIEREIAEAKIRKEKLLAEENIKNSQKLLQRIIDLLPIRIFWKDKDLNYLGCNSIFAKDAGEISSEDIIDRNDFDMTWKEQADIYRKDDKIVLLSGKSRFNYEEPQTTPTGDTIWLKTNKVPLTDLHGNTIGILGSYEDITDQKKMIAELITAKEKAEEMNRLKSSFLANMSHELRTPMVGILGFSEMINDIDNIIEIKEMAEIIHRGALRLFNTLNQILDLSILEANKTKTDYKSTDIISIIKESINLFLPESSKKDLSIRYHSQADSIIAYTDQNIIYSCLNNLIQNAIIYSEKGNIDVKVEEQLIEDKAFVVINVIDTGIGISKDNLETIFDEFRQASEGWGRSYEGTGLGLSICRKSMKIIDGTVSVKSEPGIGSEFRLTFPKNTFSNDIAPRNSPIICNKVVTKEEGLDTKPLILYVEDEKDCFELVKILLRKKYSFDKASTAEEGISKASQTEYSLILLDINLGKGKNGIDVLKEIKKIYYYNDIPIIAITGYAMEGDEQKFRAEGFSDYISKPFSKSLLYEKISNALIKEKNCIY